jgi:hypothetical protein
MSGWAKSGLRALESLMLLGASAAWAAAPPTPTARQMALNGYWRGPPGRPGAGPADDIIARMQPWVAAERARFQSAEAAGKYVPWPISNCMPAVIPGTGVPGGPAYAIEILVEARQVTLLYELDHNMRIVHIGRGHPARLAPSWAGDSVGHWEGDTLVVDTVGFNDKNVFTRGIPISPRMHVVQRLRVVDGMLEDQATFDDPGAFTAPFTMTNRFGRSAPFQEYICAENNGEGGVPTSTGKITASDVPNDAGR